MTKSTAILDIGSGKITAAVGRRGAGGMLVVEALAECEYPGYLNGEFLDAVGLYSAIDRALTEAEIRFKLPVDSVTVGVPGQFTVTECRDITYSFEKKHRLTEAEVDSFHKNVEDFNYSGYELLHIQPVYYIGDEGRKMINAVGVNTQKLSASISYMFVSTAFKNAIEEAVAAHGIQKCDFVSTLLAEAMFLVSSSVRDNFAVIVDTGYLVTDVAVVRGDGIVRQLSFSLGGGHITRSVIENLDIKYKVAEQVKRKIIYNLDFSETDDYVAEYADTVYRFNAKDVNKCAESILNKIIRTILKNLEPLALPQDTRFFITGGGAAMNTGARDYFAKNLPFDTETAYPPVPLYEKANLSGPLAVLALATGL